MLTGLNTNITCKYIPLEYTQYIFKNTSTAVTSYKLLAQCGGKYWQRHYLKYAGSRPLETFKISELIVCCELSTQLWKVQEPQSWKVGHCWSRGVILPKAILRQVWKPCRDPLQAQSVTFNNTFELWTLLIDNYPSTNPSPVRICLPLHFWGWVPPLLHHTLSIKLNKYFQVSNSIKYSHIITLLVLVTTFKKEKTAKRVVDEAAPSIYV